MATGQVSREQTMLAEGAQLTTLSGIGPGPTLALLGGVHGDEDEGVLAVRRVFQQVSQAPLAGTIKAVAPANPGAWAAQSRTDPRDGQDLARSFPGDRGGGRTAVLAAAITDEVIDGADLLIDLHSAGVRYQMPLFCGFTRASMAADDSRRAALAFGAPLIWEHPNVAAGRSLSVAAERGIPAIFAECSGGGSVDPGELDTYVGGVLAVMAAMGMLPPSFGRQGSRDVQWVYGDGDLDMGAKSGHDGFFLSSTRAGEVVGEHTEIGRLYDHDMRLLEIITAPCEGMVMFLRRQARTRVDDVLFVLAQLTDGDG